VNRKSPLSALLNMLLLFTLLLTFCSAVPVNAAFSWNVEIVDANANAIPNASDGSKTITFHIDALDPSLFDLEVRFSWDNNSWKIGENHTIAFSFEAKNINPDVEELNLNVQEIIIQVESDPYAVYSTDILYQDVSNQETQLVWRQGSSTILSTVRSFSFDVEAPKPLNPLTEDAIVKLIYLVHLGGNIYYPELGVANLHGGVHISEYVSNGLNSDGLEDPVWITVKAEPPSFLWLYVAVTLVVVGIIGTIAFLLVRRRKMKKL
jgi:hypothetical protein